MTTIHHLQEPVLPEAPSHTPSRVELVATIADFCLDLIHRCDGHAFTKESPALETLAVYAYGAVHTLSERYLLNAVQRQMLGAKLYIDFFRQPATLALANAYALVGAARHADSPRHAVIESSAAVFRDWQRDPALLDAHDFRAHLPWPEAA